MERSLLSVSSFSRKHLEFTEAALRKLIFNAQDRVNSRGDKIRGNGLDRAIRRVGTRVMIDESEFFAWIDAQNQTPKAA